MIENLDELTSKQKNDLQEFVSIAYKNKDLWWEDEFKYKPRFLPLDEYFGDIIDVNSLNEILIDFYIMDYDLNTDNKIKKVLQLRSEELCGEDIGYRVIRPSGNHAFRFKKYDDMVNILKQNISNSSEFDTKQLLEKLQNVLMELKTGDFEDSHWEEDI